jgi:hypothetical protein
MLAGVRRLVWTLLRSTSAALMACQSAGWVVMHLVSRTVLYSRYSNSLNYQHPDKVGVCILVWWLWKQPDNQHTFHHIPIMLLAFLQMGMAMGQDSELMGEVCGWINKAASKPVWAKMTPNVTDITQPARAALEQVGREGSTGVQASPTTLSPQTHRYSSRYCTVC